MNEYPAQIVVSVLHAEFPEIAKRINAKIRETIPENTMTDFGLISNVVSDFCVLTDVCLDDLRNETKSRAFSIKRRVLFAVLMKLFQPEHLTNLMKCGLHFRVSKEVQKAIKVSKKTVSVDMRTAKYYYHVYQDFKKEVDLLYSKIIENHGKANQENDRASKKL